MSRHARSALLPCHSALAADWIQLPQQVLYSYYHDISLRLGPTPAGRLAQLWRGAVGGHHWRAARQAARPARARVRPPPFLALPYAHLPGLFRGTLPLYCSFSDMHGLGVILGSRACECDAAADSGVVIILQGQLCVLNASMREVTCVVGTYICTASLAHGAPREKANVDCNPQGAPGVPAGGSGLVPAVPEQRGRKAAHGNGDRRHHHASAKVRQQGRACCAAKAGRLGVFSWACCRGAGFLVRVPHVRFRLSGLASGTKVVRT